MIKEPTTTKSFDEAQADFIAALENFRDDVLQKDGIHFRHVMTFEGFRENGMESFLIEKDYELNEQHLNAMGDTMRKAMQRAREYNTSTHEYAFKNVVNGLFDEKSGGTQANRVAAGFILRSLDLAKGYRDHPSRMRFTDESASDQIQATRYAAAATSYLEAVNVCVDSARKSAPALV